MIHAICDWLDKDGSTIISHKFCRGIIGLFRKENGTKVWRCARCKQSSAKVQVEMYQTGVTVRIPKKGNGRWV